MKNSLDLSSARNQSAFVGAISWGMGTMVSTSKHFESLLVYSSRTKKGLRFYEEIHKYPDKQPPPLVLNVDIEITQTKPYCQNLGQPNSIEVVLLSVRKTTTTTPPRQVPLHLWQF